MWFSPASWEVLVQLGVDPVMWEGDVVAHDIGNNIDDMDIPSVDI